MNCKNFNNVEFKSGISGPEFLVSAGIIVLGVTLIISAVLSAHIKSVNTSRRHAVKQISLALETYYFHNGQYPPADTQDCQGFEGFTVKNNDFMAILVESGYLPYYPSDQMKANCSIKYSDTDKGRGYQLMWQELGTVAPATGCNEPPHWYCFIKET